MRLLLPVLPRRRRRQMLAPLLLAMLLLLALPPAMLLLLLLQPLLWGQSSRYHATHFAGLHLLALFTTAAWSLIAPTLSSPQAC